MNQSKLFLSFLIFTFFVCSGYSSSSSHTSNNTTRRRCSIIETNALLLFKQNVFSYNYSYDENDNHEHRCHRLLGSDYYPIMTNWNTSIDCCNWDGVTCDDITSHVIALDLSCGMLRGTIHPNSTLYNLPHLKRLNLATNNLTNSQLPREIGRFSNSLIHLDISNSGFIGRVPTDIVTLSKLEYLDLSRNDLKLEPHVFYNLLHNSTSLIELSLANVNISSILPAYLNVSSSVKSLYLRDNCLSGKLPDNIFNLPYLEVLGLAENINLTGVFPDVYINTSIPLMWLDLSHTNLSGEILKSISHLKSLTNLNLSNTNISGEIPDSIGHLEYLTYLDLSFTNLSGEIPDSIGHLKSLKRLRLSNTNLSGRIPYSIGHLKSLISLTLSNTNVLGEIPDSIGHLKSLISLTLSNTNVLGKIPDSIGHLKSLNYLIISNTNLSGEIPYSISHLESLNYLDLHSNLIQGTFPPSICNLRNLEYMDMSNNSFTGVIPQCLGNISSSLQMIDLGNNRFHGTIPNAWNDCGGLEGLILNGNSLEGEVPSGLSKCESLKVLDLGNNHLKGTFPCWSGHLPHLQVLVLKSNKLHGPIETSSINKHRFSSLKVLDLSQNEFVGHLPGEFFRNFDAMKNLAKMSTKPEYLRLRRSKFYSVTLAVKGLALSFPKILVDYTVVDLSSNIFEGEIPNVIGGLNSLKVLNLSHNHLNDRIPNALGNLSEIESLDLSSNRLKGEIPQCLAGITSLEVLNLSQNHLVGRIPDGGQFKTFEATSFEGNPGLCGFPLPKHCEHVSAPQLEADGNEDESGFTWKVVMLGYGCGTLLGLVMGYLMLSTGRPKWFHAIVDEGELMIQNWREDMYISKNETSSLMQDGD